MREGMLHIRDVEGPKKTGSMESRLEAMEQQVFKCQGMMERGLNANHMMITEFTNKHRIDANDIGKNLSRLYDRVDQLQGQIYDLQNQNCDKSGVRSGSRSRLHTRPSTPFATSSTPVSCSRPLALATLPQEARQGTPLLPPPGPLPAPATKTERYTIRKYTEVATTADGVRAGFYVYECKTCNKCFPTFQALGGHRASHKKPRLAGASADDDSPANATTVAIAKLSKPPAMETASPPLA
ncbi:zinc finger protein ZAT5 [Hordeum vulgare]|nr:zinc finger protein ZAT5 [Hordeum vulgare]